MMRWAAERKLVRNRIAASAAPVRAAFTVFVTVLVGKVRGLV
jgi:hypothetical protein